MPRCSIRPRWFATPSPEGVALFRDDVRLRLMAIIGWGLVFGIVSSSAVEAQRMQDRPNAAEAERAISQLRSPYCPGFMLEICTSSQAAALRDSIYDLAAEGMTSNELIEWMLGRHGEEWRAVPRRSGAGLWAWMAPPVALLIGLAGMAYWLRANRATTDRGAVAESAISEADRNALAAAMRDWEAAAEEDI